MSETASSESEPDDVPMSEGYQTGNEQFYGSNSEPDTEALGQPTPSSAHLPKPQGPSLENPFAASPTNTQTPFAGQSTPLQSLFTFARTPSDTQTPFAAASTPVQPPFAAPSTPSAPPRAHRRQAPFAALSTPTGRPTVANSPEQTVRQGKRRALEDPPTPDPFQEFIHTAEQHFATQNQQWSTVAEQIRHTTAALGRNSDVLGRLTMLLDSNNQKLDRLERKEERAKARNQAKGQMGTEEGSSSRKGHEKRKEHDPRSHGEEAGDDADDADNEVDNFTSSFKRPNPGNKTKAKKKATDTMLLQRVSRISSF